MAFGGELATLGMYECFKKIAHGLNCPLKLATVCPLSTVHGTMK